MLQRGVFNAHFLRGSIKAATQEQVTAQYWPTSESYAFISEASVRWHTR